MKNRKDSPVTIGGDVSPQIPRSISGCGRVDNFTGEMLEMSVPEPPLMPLSESNNQPKLHEPKGT